MFIIKLLVTSIISLNLLLPGLAFCLSFSDGANAYKTIIETHHRLNNMYFYSAITLLVITIPALGKIRQGGQMRPALSKSLAMLIHTVNAIVITFLIIHFMPETETIFNYVLGLFGRIFG